MGAAENKATDSEHVCRTVQRESAQAFMDSMADNVRVT